MIARWTTTRIVWMMIVATILTFAMVIGTLLWSAFHSNREAALKSVDLVNGGLRDLAAEMRAFDLSTIAPPPQTSLYLLESDASNDVAAPIAITGDLAKKAADARSMQASNGEVTFYAIYLGEIHLFIIRENSPNILLARALNPETIGGMGATFRLDDLHLADMPLAAEARFAITDLDNSTLGYLVWSPPQPGAAAIDLIALPISAILSLFLVLAIAIIRVARGSGKAINAREAETTLIARRDSLTDLPNRTAFGEHLTELMHASQTEVCVLVMDINSFKRINEVADYAVGDEVIAILSLRLSDAMTSNGYLARVGGDEFRAVFSGFAAEEERDQFFAKLDAIQKAPICVNDRPFEIRLAVGYSQGFPADTTASDLIRLADLAMYEAKNLALEKPLAYHPGIEGDKLQRQKIEDALRDALVTGEEFEVRYQPIICAKTGKMVRAEALTRWKSSVLGRMSPDRFIPIAESSGLIVPLGKSLMNQVCTDLRAWSDLQVSVNLSPAQLRDPDFMAETAKIITTHGVQAKRIEFELTEGLFVDDPANAGTKLAQLRGMGHSIALDDFGTGFSSIGYLRQMKFDKLKIDKTFIDDLGTTPNAENLLRSLALLAKSFDLSIVAEGVERESQYETLYALGYDFIQGYYCGKAMPFNDLFSIFTGQLTNKFEDLSIIDKAS